MSCPVRDRATTQLSLLLKLHVQVWGMPELPQVWECMLGLFSQSGHLHTLLVGEELCWKLRTRLCGPGEIGCSRWTVRAGPLCGADPEPPLPRTQLVDESEKA